MLLLLLPVVTFAQGTKPPAEGDAKALALKSLLAFNKAVQAKDFKPFHAQISSVWRSQITAEKLQAIFETFIEQGIDIADIEAVDPKFSEPPKIDEDGVLILEGRYPTAPNGVTFRLKYIYEKGWKLVGIKVDVEPAGDPTATVPSLEESQALARESLLAFNKAIQAKSFVEFHKDIAAAWQKQITPGKFLELFATFVEREADISGVGKLTPKFEKPPALDEDNLLLLLGSYPTRPYPVKFKLRYLFEPPEWKLVNIAVDIGAGEE